MFDDFQKKIVSWALTCLAGMVVVAFVFALIALGSKFAAAFGAVIWPLAIAMILSLLLQPVCDFLERKLRFPRGLSVATLFALIVLAAAALAFLVVPLCLREAAELFRGLPGLWDRAMERFPDLAVWIDENFRREDIRTRLASVDAERVKAILEECAPHMGALLRTSGAFFAKIAASASIPIYFYYLISERRDLIGKIEAESRMFFSESVSRDVAFLARQFRDILISFFRGQVVIGFLYGVILAVGFAALGVPGGVLIGLLVGMMNVVPYLGTLVGLGLILPLSFLSGGIWTAAGALAVFGAAQLAESYFLTPKIMGERTGLHPMVIMLAVFFWGTALDGVLGMVLAVPLTAFFVVFWRLVKARRGGNASLG